MKLTDYTDTTPPESQVKMGDVVKIIGYKPNKKGVFKHYMEGKGIVLFVEKIFPDGVYAIVKLKNKICSRYINYEFQYNNHLISKINKNL